jgi:hypothetical protein
MESTAEPEPEPEPPEGQLELTLQLEPEPTAAEEGVPPPSAADVGLLKQMRRRKFQYPAQSGAEWLAASAGGGAEDGGEARALRLFAQVEREYAMVRTIFDKLDRDRDGHLNFEETVGLAQITGGSLSRHEYEVFVCDTVGSDAEYGLTAHDLCRVYCELALGVLAEDHAKLEGLDDAALEALLTGPAAGVPPAAGQRKARRPKRGMRRFSVTGEGSAGAAMGRGLRRISIMGQAKDLDALAAAAPPAPLPPALLAEYQRLLACSQTAVDVRGGCPEHAALLSALWVDSAMGDPPDPLVPALSASDHYLSSPSPRDRPAESAEVTWSQLGFQNEDPVTDFRGAGLLGLECLAALARTEGRFMRRELAVESTPLSICSIQVTHMLLNLLDITQLSASAVQATGKATALFFAAHGGGGDAGEVAGGAAGFVALNVACTKVLVRMWRVHAAPAAGISTTGIRTTGTGGGEPRVNWEEFDRTLEDVRRAALTLLLKPRREGEAGLGCNELHAWQMAVAKGHADSLVAQKSKASPTKKEKKAAAALGTMAVVKSSFDPADASDPWSKRAPQQGDLQTEVGALAVDAGSVVKLLRRVGARGEWLRVLLGDEEGFIPAAVAASTADGGAGDWAAGAQ